MNNGDGGRPACRKGQVLALPGGVVGVPVDYQPGADDAEVYWRVVVVGGSHRDYPVGGDDLYISESQIRDAVRLSVDALGDDLTREHHVVDGDLYLCHVGDYYCSANWESQ